MSRARVRFEDVPRFVAFTSKGREVAVYQYSERLARRLLAQKLGPGEYLVGDVREEPLALHGPEIDRAPSRESR